MISKEKKRQIIEQFGKNPKDTGTAEVQIAMFSTRIAALTEHLKSNPKDYATRRGLLKLVGKRRQLLNYLVHTDIDRYRSITKELKIRK